MEKWREPELNLKLFWMFIFYFILMCAMLLQNYKHKAIVFI